MVSEEKKIAAVKVEPAVNNKKEVPEVAEAKKWTPLAMLQTKKPCVDIRDEDGSWMCQSCNQYPCLMIQITPELQENDEFTYDEALFAEDPSKANRGRRYRAYRYASFLIEGRLGKGVCKPHYSCVHSGILMMFPPFDGKVTGYKSSRDDDDGTWV